MGVAHDFLKDEHPFSKKSEEALVFFIDNYSELMRIYRVVKTQNEETRAKKNKAHEDLQKLRDRVEALKTSKKKLNEQEKIEIAEKEEYLVKLREENDVIYYRGVPLTYDELSHLVITYQKVFDKLEIVDRKVRTKIASSCKNTSKILLHPFDRMLKFSIRHSKKGLIKDLLKETKKIIRDIPVTIEEVIMSDMNVDLSKHKPSK